MEMDAELVLELIQHEETLQEIIEEEAEIRRLQNHGR